MAWHAECVAHCFCRIYIGIYAQPMTHTCVGCCLVFVTGWQELCCRQVAASRRGREPMRECQPHGGCVRVQEQAGTLLRLLPSFHWQRKQQAALCFKSA